jgi:hypothetical protein
MQVGVGKVEGGVEEREIRSLLEAGVEKKVEEKGMMMQVDGLGAVGGSGLVITKMTMMEGAITWAGVEMGEMGKDGMKIVGVGEKRK